MIEIGALRIKYGFVALLAAGFFFDSSGLMIYSLAAAILHEIGHYGALRLTGGSAFKLELSLTGGVVSTDYPQENTAAQLFMLLAGPAANLFLALGCGYAGNFTGSSGLSAFAGINFVLGTFNLLPALPLDGGQALSCLLLRLFGEKRARAAVAAISAFIAALLTVAGAIVLFNTGYNLTLLAAAALIFVGVVREGE